jgi:hypothetical protein
MKNRNKLWRTGGGGMGERGTSAEVVLALEDKILRLLPYKEPVDFLFFPIFPTVLTSMNFVGCVTSSF